tara:strand:+ start:861 stop:1085 length:225 start_codon:yes stop_codon:yes gene_type:complete
MKDWKQQIADTTKPSGVFITIKDVKKELGITNKDIAKMFNLTPLGYANSSAKHRYEDALVDFYNLIEKHKRKDN